MQAFEVQLRVLIMENFEKLMKFRNLVIYDKLA